MNGIRFNFFINWLCFEHRHRSSISMLESELSGGKSSFIKNILLLNTSVPNPLFNIASLIQCYHKP